MCEYFYLSLLHNSCNLADAPQSAVTFGYLSKAHLFVRDYKLIEKTNKQKKIYFYQGTFREDFFRFFSDLSHNNFTWDDSFQSECSQGNLWVKSAFRILFTFNETDKSFCEIQKIDRNLVESFSSPDSEM